MDEDLHSELKAESRDRTGRDTAIAAEKGLRIVLMLIFRLKSVTATLRRDYGSWRLSWRRRTRSCSG